MTYFLLPILTLVMMVSSRSFGGGLLCEVLQVTQARMAARTVETDLTKVITNSQGDNLTLSVERFAVKLTVGEGSNAKVIEVQERLSEGEFRALAERVKTNRDNFGPKMSYMKESLAADLNHVRLHAAFYDQPTPIRAAQELVNLVKRTKQSGGGTLKVELITDGVPTTMEMIRSWSRWAATVNDVVEQGLLPEVAKEVAVRRREVEEQQRVEEGRQLLERILNSGEAADPAQNPKIDLEVLLNKTVQDPKAVLIKLDGFVDSVDYSRPLVIRIEKYQGGISINIDGSQGQPKSLADVAARIQVWGKNNWRTYESLDGRAIPGN